MGILDWFTKIRDEEVEEFGAYHIKAHAFTNEYGVYDDIGVSTRLEEKKKIFGRTWWKDIKGPVATRALYLINAEGQSVIAYEEHKYQDDNYVSVRAPRFGIQIGGTVGEIFNPNEYQFKIDAYYLDWEYLKDKDWDSLKKAITVSFPIDISFPKDKVRQFDGVVGFHAAKKGGHEFRRMTQYNASPKLVIPKELKDKFDFYAPW